ncbi:ParB/RepB/Spo0J family partition protein [Candidatus Bathyarchaeota archaeon]|nr:ParB/RepB/Spo0J family partition protein [Candidatus Bathyarchaeota archaeon]
MKCLGVWTLLQIDITLIKPSPYQPRLIFDVSELKEEIENDGLISELVVRKQENNYELIDGERRLRALKQLGWKQVPVRVIKLKKGIVRRSVYKVNKVRENYTVEEESRYFKKLTDEGMTPWEISKELSVDFHWVLAHLNVFKFSGDIQKAMWTGKISASHMVALENVIARNIKEAKVLINEIINRKLTIKETKKIVNKQKEKVEEMRINAVKDFLPEVAPKIAKLKTPEDFDKAVKVLKKTAKKKREKSLSPEQKAIIEEEKKQRQEELIKRKKEKEKLEKRRIRNEAKKLAKELKEKERAQIKKEVEQKLRLKMKEEAKKLAKELKEKERAQIKKVKEEIEKKSLTKMRSNLKKLTKRIEKLQTEKNTLLKNKAFFLEALNFNCPHCKSSCVVYQDGKQYVVKRSAEVAVIHEKPMGPNQSAPSISPPKTKN